MIRFPLSMAILALCLVALQCTASDPDLGDDGDTHGSGGGGGGGGGGDGPQDNPAGTARTQNAQEEEREGELAASPTVTTTTAENNASGPTGSIDTGSPGVGTGKSSSEHSSTSSSSSSSSGTNPPVNGDGSLAPNAHAEPTDGTLSTNGRVIDDPSDKHDPSILASTAVAAAASGALNNPHSSSPGTSKVGTINSSPGGTGVIVSAGSAGSISPGTNKDQTQQSTNSQAKISTSQNPGKGASSSTSSGLPLAHQTTQEKKDTSTPKPLKQSEKDTATSEDVNKKGDTTNNNKQQTGGQGNAGTPTDPKTVSNIPSNKGAIKTPKPEPGIPTGTESKINSTTTTTMAEDLQPISDANETSKTPTTTLAKQTKTLGQLQTLGKNDGSSSTPLLFAFATLVTLTMVSVVHVS